MFLPKLLVLGVGVSLWCISAEGGCPITGLFKRREPLEYNEQGLQHSTRHLAKRDLLPDGQVPKFSNFPDIDAALLKFIPVCNGFCANWIRLFHHDWGTFDASRGTGGLDGSIQFELDRGENVGLENVVQFFLSLTKKEPTFSLADMIALGAIQATWRCTRRFIPFKTGRKDATGPNEPNMFPGPSTTDLNVLYQSFNVSGMTKEDAVVMTFGGHTIGRVADPIEGLQQGDAFDRTPEIFDADIINILLGRVSPPPSVQILPSDQAFLNDPDAVSLMNSLANDSEMFKNKFALGMVKMLGHVPNS